MTPDKNRHYKLAAALAGLLYCFYYVSIRMDWHFIDNVNLIIHEAGHVVFMLFGNTLTVAGGSILQILVPLIFLIYFLFQQSYYSAAVMSYWTGLSIINVAVYAGDAVKMQLPLLTGDTAGHDWNQLLFQFGLLRQTETISNIFLTIGVLVILIGFFIALYKWRESQ